MTVYENAASLKKVALLTEGEQGPGGRGPAVGPERTPGGGEAVSSAASRVLFTSRTSRGPCSVYLNKGTECSSSRTAVDGGSGVEAALGTLAMARAEPGEGSVVLPVYPSLWFGEMASLWLAEVAIPL